MSSLRNISLLSYIVLCVKPKPALIDHSFDSVFLIQMYTWHKLYSRICILEYNGEMLLEGSVQPVTLRVC